MLQQTFTPTFWRASVELGLLNFLGTASQVCVAHTYHALAVAVHKHCIPLTTQSGQ